MFIRCAQIFVQSKLFMCRTDARTLDPNRSVCNTRLDDITWKGVSICPPKKTIQRQTIGVRSEFQAFNRSFFVSRKTYMKHVDILRIDMQRNYYEAYF